MKSSVLDEVLLKRISDGDVNAFNCLHARYDRLVQAKLQLLLSRNNDFISDLSQEIWIKIFTKADTYNPEKSQYGNAIGWIGRITSNTVKMYLRSKGIKIDIEYIEITENEDVQRDSEKAFLSDQTRDIDVLECALKQMEKFKKAHPKGYKLFSLWVELELSMKEFTEIINKKPGATRQFISHYKKILWGYLNICLDSGQLDTK